MTDKKLIDVAPELAQKMLDDARTWTTRESAADRTILANGEIPAHLASPEKVDAEGFPITNRVELAYRMTGDLRRYADELHPGCEREVNLRVAADVIESLIEEYSEAKGEMANMREEYWRLTKERDGAQAENRSLKQELQGHLQVFRDRQAELERALSNVIHVRSAMAPGNIVVTLPDGAAAVFMPCGDVAVEVARRIAERWPK